MPRRQHGRAPLLTFGCALIAQFRLAGILGGIALGNGGRRPHRFIGNEETGIQSKGGSGGAAHDRGRKNRTGGF
jgi:hypothetical protein